jgi:hypothetical protein
MIELLADLFFALEAIVEERIGLDFRMGNFDGYRPAVFEVGGPVDGSHPASSHEIFQAVMIELGAGME